MARINFYVQWCLWHLFLGHLVAACKNGIVEVLGALPHGVYVILLPQIFPEPKQSMAIWKYVGLRWGV